MKRAVVKLEVSVVCEVPDHIVERDMDNHSSCLTESEIWHDYAVGAIQRRIEVRHGTNEATDWITLRAEVVDHEMEEEPEDMEQG